jgi:hypothetical protein
MRPLSDFLAFRHFVGFERDTPTAATIFVATIFIVKATPASAAAFSSPGPVGLLCHRNEANALSA